MKLYMTVATCSIGAAVQGWDQTGTNGANLSFHDVFNLEEGVESDYWIIGLVNAAPYLGSAFVGCWMADPFNNYFGRRGTIFASAIILIATPLGGAFCNSWETLFATRIIMGLGMGLKGATTPVFAAENAPAAIRGALVMTWQFWTAFGIFLGTAINLAVYYAGSIGWRLQLGSAFIPAVPLAMLVYLCPESPRWYIKKGMHEKAFGSLLKLRKHPIQAARDLYYINTQIRIEEEIVGESNYVKRFMELFTIPRIRRATLASFIVMIAQQMCGRYNLDLLQAQCEWLSQPRQLYPYDHRLPGRAC
jgi:MFS family permease